MLIMPMKISSIEKPVGVQALRVHIAVAHRGQRFDTKEEGAKETRRILISDAARLRLVEAGEQ
ncbi:hypothetical protein JOS77_24190 [Chromobacterium haemolyticum]|nr:hypothetical protein JOS77_24190 [Chromobacterium haemolyticum]